MRFKLGRPDLTDYASMLAVPQADNHAGEVVVTFLGVSSLLFDDGDSVVLVDGFFTRPSLLSVGLGKIQPDLTRITSGLDRLGFGAGARSLDAVVVVHSHFDHALDSAVVADLTDAVLVGGESTANVGRGHGLAPDQLKVLTSGDSIDCGTYTLTLIASAHCPPDRFPGTIDSPVVPPAKASAYKCGEAWSILITHTSGRTALVQGSAGYVEGALDGRQADVAYLGVGQLGIQDDDYIRAYWNSTVRAVGAKRVVMTHWDDFFRPLDKPLRALPYVGDDLDFTISTLSRLAAEDGIQLNLPNVWAREDPWRQSR